MHKDRKTAAPERGSRLFAFAGLQLVTGEVLQGVRFGDLADDTAGVARRQHAVGDIVGDHAAGADDHIIADGHPADDGHIAADPHIVADADGLGVFGDGGQTVIPQHQPQPFMRDEGV